jgi:hypothetical protein
MAVVLIGCSNEHGQVAADAGSSSVPTSTPRPHLTTSPTKKPKTPSPHPTVDTVPEVSGPLADFPLDLGYPDVNGDDGSAVAITAKPATRRFEACDRTVWDPRHGATDVIGVEFRGEAEYVRGRTLVRYPDADAASAAVAAAHDAIAACSDEPDGEGQGGTTHTLTDESLGGDQSLVWTDTYYSLNNGEKQHDTGLVVYLVARVGRAVLLAYEYGEGNGTPATRAQAMTRSTHAERTLVDEMRNAAIGA